MSSFPTRITNVYTKPYIHKAHTTSQNEIKQILQFRRISSNMKPCDMWNSKINEFIQKIIPVLKKQAVQHLMQLNMLKLIVTDIIDSKNDFAFLISLIKKDRQSVLFFEACSEVNHKLIHQHGINLIDTIKNHWELINPENKISYNYITGIMDSRLTHCRRNECINCSTDCDQESIIRCESCRMASYCSVEHLKLDSIHHNKEECVRFLSMRNSPTGLIIK